MPVEMMGDILAAELSHMQAYIRFCSCQLNGAALLQQKTDEDADFKEFLKVRTAWDTWTLCCYGKHSGLLSLDAAARLLMGSEQLTGESLQFPRQHKHGAQLPDCVVLSQVQLISLGMRTVVLHPG